MSKIVRSSAILANAALLVGLAVMLITQPGLPALDMLLLLAAASLPALNLWIMLGNGSERRSGERRGARDADAAICGH